MGGNKQQKYNMHINIEMISNGWVVAIQAKQGQSAIFCKDYDAVLEYLASIKQSNTEQKSEDRN